MGFETQPVVEAITLQSLKLPNPIHDTAANRSPIVFVVRLVHYVFAVAVSNALFRQQFIAGWIGRTADGRSTTRKTMIVALARKLLIALWRLVTTGEMTQDIKLRPAAA